MDASIHDVDGEEDTFRILITTDIHLGYADDDPIRGNDTINTFEEILQIAKKRDVDLILNGGDLFHDNKPSRRIMYECINLLRKYCLGDKPCSVEYLSDQSVDFSHTSFPHVNYNDPNLSIAIPFFSIHGNHDDPAGAGSLCSLDLLSAAGLVNFFGRYTNLEKIEIKPVLLKKGSTRLALYGLGSIRDERLHRMFVQKKVYTVRPKQHQDDWFNLFVIHQNRSKHGATNYIPEQYLDDFLDLVFWGHEHECLIDPAFNSVQKFFVTQPGSSVATSLSKGETGTKHVGILSIKGKEFNIEKIPLETVRQFYFEDLILSETSLNPEDPKIAVKVEKYCVDKVEEMIDIAETERSNNRKQPLHPLIRLRVDHSGGFDSFSAVRFGQKFLDRVANPRDIVLFNCRKHRAPKDEFDAKQTSQQIQENMLGDGVEIGRVEDSVTKYFEEVDPNQKLKILSAKNMGKAIYEYVQKEENKAVEEIVKCEVDSTQKHLQTREVSEENIDDEIGKYRERRKGEEDEKHLQEALQKARENRELDDEDGALDNDQAVGTDDDVSSALTSSTRGRGRGRGRGRARGQRGAQGSQRGGRGRKAAVVEEKQTAMDSFLSVSKRESKSSQPHVISDSDEDISFEPSPPRGQKSRASGSSQRSRAASGRTKRKPTYFDSDDDDDVDFGDIPSRKRTR